VSATPLADVCAEGERLVAAAAERGLTLRLCGGAAVAHACPSARTPPLARVYKDVDVVALRRERRPVADLLEELGYRARDEFNVLSGDSRLLFWDHANDRQLDVLLDRFEMCHALDLAPRLHIHPVTLHPADLLLTKLQVRETNDRDVNDALALILDTSPDVARVADVLCHDWGWWRTATEVLDRVVDGATRLDDDRASRVRAWADRLRSEVEGRAKPLQWRLRAKIGDRLRWYEEPEDDY
jgi:hypothetical protein